MPHGFAQVSLLALEFLQLIFQDFLAGNADPKMESILESQF